MDIRDGSVFVAAVTTIGRKTGRPRTVELRLVYFGGKVYASSARVQGKHWCQNMIKNPSVEVAFGDERFSCLVKQVTDENLRKRILSLRDSTPLLDRVVFEMLPLNSA
jgi:deazaflavin-dependent oxidoreductase (nitroreductase family)